MKYEVHLKAFTTQYTDEGRVLYSPENSLKAAMGDLLSKDREKVTKALAWVRQNVRDFVPIP